MAILRLVEQVAKTEPDPVVEAIQAVQVPMESCRNCSKLFVRTLYFKKYCSTECRDARQLSFAAERQKAKYWSDPETSKENSRKWYAEGGYKYHKEYIAKLFAVCSKCGQHTRNLNERNNPDYTCSSCKTAARLTHKDCYFCRTPLLLPPGARKNGKAYCRECRDILTRTGERWSITRERVRQLVNQMVSEYAVRGYEISARDALSLVEAKRFKLPPPKVKLRLKAP